MPGFMEDGPHIGLTPREQQVLQLVIGGYTSQAIAEELVIAVSTVKRHLINIYLKLDVHRRRLSSESGCKQRMQAALITSH